MRINIRIIILSTFVATLLALLVIRSCKRPPKKGEVVYQKHCASCHGNNGEGFRNLIPPINDSTFLDTHSDEFACIVAFGISREIIVNGVSFDQPMDGIAELNEVEIANVGNYIYDKWSTSKKKFTPKEVETSLANCQ